MKRIIDDSGRLFGKISIIDVIVAIVVVILAIAAFSKFNVGDSPLATANIVDVEYTVKVFGISMPNVEHIRRGDRVYITDVGVYVGTITDVKVEDAVAPEPLVDGTVVLARVHERYDVTITIESQCSFSNGRYYAERTIELNANAEIWISTKYNYIFGNIMSITEVNAE